MLIIPELRRFKSQQLKRCLLKVEPLGISDVLVNRNCALCPYSSSRDEWIEERR